MTAEECIKGRRSIRKFTAEPVSHELLARIVETASFAPSWKNTQITRYIAVEGTKKDALAKGTSIFPGNGVIIENAPMVIAVTAITGRSGYERDGSFSTSKGTHWQSYDAGLAGEAFCLAAWEKGLGTVIMGIFEEAKVKEALQIPETESVSALIALGYPEEVPEAPKRKGTELLLKIVK